uniref:Uncharacterized protein n=1 Tax=Anopheles quadriannulatus TaxID=34691 RepID=A0A182XS98_ANOQN
TQPAVGAIKWVCYARACSSPWRTEEIRCSRTLALEILQRLIASSTTPSTTNTHPVGCEAARYNHSATLARHIGCTHEITRRGSRWILSPEIMASRSRALPSIVATCATGYRAVNGKLRYNFIFRQCQMGSI